MLKTCCILLFCIIHCNSYDVIDLVRHVMSSKNISQLEALEVAYNSLTPGSTQHQKIADYLVREKWIEHPDFHYYDVIFRDKSTFGLSFKLSFDKQYVVDVIDPLGAAAKTNLVKLGDILVAVNFHSVQGIDLNQLGDYFSESINDIPRVLRLKRKIIQQTATNPGKKKMVNKKANIATVLAEPSPFGNLRIRVPKFKGALGLQIDIGLNVVAVDPESPMAGKISSFAKSNKADVFVIADDRIVGINGRKTIGVSFEDFVGMVKKTTGELILDFETDRSFDWIESSDSLAENIADSETTQEEESHLDTDSFGKEGTLFIVSPPIMYGNSFPILFAQYSLNPTCNEQTLLLSQPNDIDMACKPSNENFDSDSIVMVERGMCSFVTKGNNIAAKGTRNIIVATRSFEPMMAMQASVAELTKPIELVMAMIDSESATALISLLKFTPLKVIMHSPVCPSLQDSSAGDEKDDIDWSYDNDLKRKRSYIPLDTLTVAVWDAVSKSTKTFFGLRGNFGPKYDSIVTNIKSASAFSIVIAPEPYTACESFADSGIQFNGAFVLVDRGICPYNEKALHVKEVGGIGILVVDTEPKNSGLVPMGMSPEQAAMINIPGYSVSKETGKYIRETLAANAADGLVLTKVYRKQFFWCDDGRTRKVCGIDT